MWAAGVAEDPVQAVRALERTLQLDPANGVAKSALTVAKFEAGVAAAQAERRIEARQWLQQVCAEDPKHEAAWLWLASVTDEPTEAIAHLERALQLNSTNERARAGIEHFRGVANTEWFCPICQARSKSRFTTCPSCRAVLDLARGHEAIGNPSPDVVKIREGAARLGAEVRTKPDFVSHYYLGMALLNLGRPEEAVAHFRAARTFRPSDEGLAAQVDLLERAVNETAPPTRRIAVPVPEDTEAVLKSVLVVDENPVLRKLVGMSLQKRGYVVMEAQDGTETLEVIEARGRPDVLVMSPSVVESTGNGLSHALRQNSKYLGIPVIYLTGPDGSREKIRRKMSSSDRWLARPFVPSELVRLVNDCCPSTTTDTREYP
jgi:CheY-like chemotaxis protein